MEYGKTKNVGKSLKMQIIGIHKRDNKEKVGIMKGKGKKTNDIKKEREKEKVWK